MLLLDISLLLVVAILHRYSHAPRVSEIIFWQFAVGIAFGYLTPLFNLYEYVHPAWFFMIRAYIMVIALWALLIENASRLLGLVVVSGMVYNLLMFYEYALDLHTWVDHYYTPFMFINMLLQIVYIFGIGDGGRVVNRWVRSCARSVTDRYFCGIISNSII